MRRWSPKSSSFSSCSSSPEALGYKLRKMMYHYITILIYIDLYCILQIEPCLLEVNWMCACVYIYLFYFTQILYTWPYACLGFWATLGEQILFPHTLRPLHYYVQEYKPQTWKQTDPSGKRWKSLLVAKIGRKKRRNFGISTLWMDDTYWSMTL